MAGDSVVRTDDARVARGVRAGRLFNYRFTAAGCVIPVIYGIDAWMGAAATSPLWAEAVVSVLSIGCGCWLVWTWWSWRGSFRLAVAEYAGVDDDSPLVHTQASSREVHRRETAARYGAEAAVYSSSAWRAIRGLRIAAATAFIVVLVGANLYAGLLARYWLMMGPALALILIVVAFRVRSASEVRKLGQCIVDAMGGDADLARRVPLPSADYLQFCAEQDVPAYPYGRPDWERLFRAKRTPA